MESELDLLVEAKRGNAQELIDKAKQADEKATAAARNLEHLVQEGADQREAETDIE